MTTLVLVHGNPETADVWGPLIGELGREDVKTLSPPGFGAPVPEGFSATADGYAAWLAGELESLGSPVDLVGHDWGGGHVMRIAVERPDLIRSWATDIAGCFAPDYVWHDMAQLWQTPGAGEEAVAGMVSAPLADRVALLQSLGVTEAVASKMAAGANEEMAACILTLYRSATQPAMAEFGRRLGDAASRPGLVIIPTEDHYTGGRERALWAADQAGAQVAVLEGLGHWWMVQDPSAGAEALRGFLANLDQKD
jgi:pimeloyl-ACP methyl ester carboxylesterase